MGTMPYMLIVDDDPEDSEMLAGCFRRKNYRVHVQSLRDGQQAFSFLESLAEEDLPAVLVTDYQMPVLSGVELLKLLQLNHRYDKLAKVVLSTSSHPSDKEECMKRGAQKYLVKPCEWAQLDAIADYLSELIFKKKQVHRTSH